MHEESDRNRDNWKEKPTGNLEMNSPYESSIKEHKLLRTCSGIEEKPTW
jgi:hypothetical protein